ncbi:helix-turn-helix domain-containing protein [Apilactobacillus micheneri]|uniref:helix-turn-helix domain-containing protein n=1 Tax=Apilactobacillus micheneri TaxID=1899430 RepID=UPI001127F272|nr:helix-turn-helix domain-containing protein [Apilactobacillus micheneri]TPR50745.1 hypothetical protein DY126_06770 [Apilactobacillus micheneri]
MEQFYKQYAQFEEAGLKPNEVSVLSHLYDRMNLSFGRKAYYDKKQNGYYVIYTREELADKINLVASTVSRIIKKLSDKKWIIIKKQFNAPNKYFLPKFIFEKRHASENAPSHVAKEDSNQTDSSQTDRGSNTVNTENNNKYTGEDKLTQWIKSTNSVVGLTLNTLKIIQKFSKNDLEESKHIVRIILNSRNKVAKQNKIEHTAVTQFESNKRLQDDLGKQLDHIFSYVKNHGYTSYYGYLTNALKDYFKIAFGLAKPTKIVKPNGQRVFFNDHEPIKEELPEWAKENPEERKDRHQKEDTMTLEEHEARKAELEDKLAMLRGKIA